VYIWSLQQDLQDRNEASPGDSYNGQDLFHGGS
jgi:hypothetical protein